jgi:hypothetical protein
VSLVEVCGAGPLLFTHRTVEPVYSVMLCGKKA